MQKTSPNGEINLMQFDVGDNGEEGEEASPQQLIQNSRKQYFHVKLMLSVILVIMATISVQSKMQVFAPFVRTVQNFFNYHLLTHQSQDIYQGGDVIFYRTQEYRMAHDIMAFFQNYEETMHKFHNDSFFFPLKDVSKSRSDKMEMVQILIVSEIDRKYDQQYSVEQKESNQRNIDGLKIQLKQRNRAFLSVHEQQWILQRPLNQIGQFFNLTVLNKQFYQRKVKRIQLQIKLPIRFKDGRNCSVEVKTICIFYSAMMMAVKVDTNIIDENTEDLLQMQQNHHHQQEEQSENTAQNLGMRKLSQHHNMSFTFQQIQYFIFAVNCILFCVQLMVIIRTNYKIEQNLRQQRQFQDYIDRLTFINKQKGSPLAHPHHNLREGHQHQLRNQNQFQLQSQNVNITRKLSYYQRLQMVGLYNVLQLTLSFLVLITVNSKGLVSLWCWIKLTIYLSQTGNRMMIGFLFKKAIPFYLKIIFNLSILLSGFVFFSMVMFQYSKKFETVQLSYYEYLFNYFQYGIFENFKAVKHRGMGYSFLYFLQTSILVMIGNNILMSILAQQVLKNSNMQDLIEFIQQIQVECPVCGSPPEVRKKIKLKTTNQRDQAFMSKYFQAKTQEENNSKYEIKILSPQLSPMFHKSQLKEKTFKLRKYSNNYGSLIGQQSIMLDSPPISPLNLPSPLSPLGPGQGSRRLQDVRKKVKIQIGGQVEHRSRSKFEQFSKTVQTKTQVINKIIHQLSHQPTLTHNPANKALIIQFLKKKIQQIKHITTKWQ